ncbi:MAG: hypothetical protein ACYCSN_08140 [Acidobacteriaceae bacterium]
MLRVWWLCAALWMLAAGAQAQQACPWLTEGTAAKLMGGPVTANIHAMSAGEGSCVFTRGTASDAVVLRIEAGHGAPAACAAGERLRGVGDDALRCATDEADGHREMIQGRVRTTQFALTLTVRGDGGRLLSRDAQRSAAEQAAEEVAGSLF